MKSFFGLTYFLRGAKCSRNIVTFINLPSGTPYWTPSVCCRHFPPAYQNENFASWVLYVAYVARSISGFPSIFSTSFLVDSSGTKAITLSICACMATVAKQTNVTKTRSLQTFIQVTSYRVLPLPTESFLCKNFLNRTISLYLWMPPARVGGVPLLHVLDAVFRFKIRHSEMVFGGHRSRHHLIIVA